MCQDAKKLVLDNLRIASPCEMAWDDMERTGEDATRFCLSCTKNVHDISLMSRRDAELLLQRATVNNPDGSVCVRLYKRQDGTVLTDDCPRGLKRVRDSWRKLRTAAAALVAFAISGGAAKAGDEGGRIMGKVAPSAIRNNQTGKPQGTTPAGATTPGTVKQSAEMGNVVQGRSVMMGSPAPVAMPVITGGKPVASVSWHEQAMSLPGMQALVDKLTPLEMRPQPSDGEKLQMAKLHMQIARLAESKNIPLFARGHYQSAKKLAESLPQQKDLLKEITERYQKNSALLKMPACDK